MNPAFGGKTEEMYIKMQRRRMRMWKNCLARNADEGGMEGENDCGIT